MNLFASDVDPFLSACALDDKRLYWQVSGTAQILSNAHSMIDLAVWTPKPELELPFSPQLKVDNAKHACMEWVVRSHANFAWTLKHHIGLAAEYAHRKGKTHPSYSDVGSFYATTNWAKPGKLDTGFYNGAKSKGDDLDFTDKDVHYAYRLYLHALWTKEMPTWTNRRPPRWLHTRKP